MIIIIEYYYFVPGLSEEQANQRCSFPRLTLLLSGLSAPAILATSRTYHMNPGQVLGTLLSTEALKCYGFCGVFPSPLNKSVRPYVSFIAPHCRGLMSNAGSISRDLLLILPLITCSASYVRKQAALLSWLTVWGQKSMTKLHQQLFSLLH